MKRFILLMISFIITATGWTQTYLGTFEAGDNVPLLHISADAVTGAPTDPVNLNYSIYKLGSIINTGGMNNFALGVASATYNTNGDSPGYYHVLYSGLIHDVTAYSIQSYTLVSSGNGQENIGDEVAGLNGVSPLTTNTYQSFQNETLSTIHDTAQSITNSINIVQSGLSNLLSETKTGTRELSRSRLWYAQSTINFATRKVPADLPSHLEVQLASPDDVLFASPVETIFKWYYYPATTSTKASREVRLATPPQDGTFYLLPNISWDE
jgi:hypothetical protein